MIQFWRSLRFTVVFAVLLGAVYPLLVLVVGNELFPFQSQGSLVRFQNHLAGSELIAQKVTNPKLFHPRPSAINYAANGSGGSNLGPSNLALMTEVKKNLAMLKAQNPNLHTSEVSPSMVESSGSGLAPYISIHDAMQQVPRVSSATGLRPKLLDQIIQSSATGPFLGLWGNRSVNVMQLNLAVESRLGVKAR